jgi:hypothetical protein
MEVLYQLSYVGANRESYSGRAGVRRLSAELAQRIAEQTHEV